MKKLCAILLALCILCGCQKFEDFKGTKEQKIPTTFSATVEITQYGNMHTAELIVQNPKRMQCTYTAPEVIAGLKLEMTEESFKAEHLGIAYQNAECILPPGHFLKLLSSVLSDLQETPELHSTLQENFRQFEGYIGDIPFIVEIDKSSNALSRLSIGAYDLEIIFLNFKNLETEEHS